MSIELADTFAGFIADQAGARHVEVVKFNKLSGGAIQDNFGLTLTLTGGTHPGQHQLVVRQDAPSGIPESLTRPQEFAVLKAAFEAGVTAPQPLWLCEDNRVSGNIFYVMKRAGGIASPRKLVKAEHSLQARSKLTRRFGEELARLHSIRPPKADLGFLPLPQPEHPALSRVMRYRRYLEQIGEPHPVLEWALNWLQDRAPDPGPTVLCHCDFRTGNYMMDDDELTAVLDWEFATWSDPCEDLGWLCSRSWRFGQDQREVGGMGDKPDLLAGYRDISGTDIDPSHVSYWEVMALVRWAMIALQQAQRHISGEQSSLELALTGRMVPQMEFDLLRQISELEALQ